MEKKEITIEGPLEVGKVTLIVVAKTLLNYKSSDRGAVFFADKRPTHVVLISGSERRAYDIDGEEISLDEVVAVAPDLAQMLQNL